MERSLSDLREQYFRGTLVETDLPTHPFDLLRQWLDAAVAEGIKDANAMTLSTVSGEGQPSSRVVLLKGLDERGLSFFTNYESRKGQELESHPQAAINFWWKEHERQVSLRGSVRKLSREESEEYFHSRPYASQIGAWVSRQGLEIPNREWLEDREKELRAKYPESEIVPMPDYWGGFLFCPTAIEFWQGRPSRLHDRIAYRLADEAAQVWKPVRLSP